MATDTERVDVGPSTNASLILAELSSVNVGGGVHQSPLAPYAQQIYNLGLQYNVDPAFFIGTAYGESQYGLSSYNGFPTSIYNPATGQGTYNWGSITHAAYGGECSPDASGNCTIGDPRWGQYPDILAGVSAFYQLLTNEYYPNGQDTLDSIWWGVGGSCNPCVDGTHAYGPCSDNHGDCSSLDTVLTVMNRIAGSGGPLICPFGIDPSTGLCMMGPDSNFILVVLGLCLVGGAAYAAWKVTSGLS